MERVRNLVLILLLLMHTDLISQETKMYPCQPPCNIGIQIGGFMSSDTITADALLKAGKVTAEAGNFTILSYRITMDCTGFEDLIEIDNPGDKFCERAIASFQRLRRGIFISIDCITAKDSYGYMTGLKPAFYIIR